MKRLIFAGLLITVVQCAMAQQNEPDHRWSVGVKAGSTISYITETGRAFSPDRPNISSPVFNYTGGLSIQYFAESNFALQVEGFYTQKGWQEIFVPEGGSRFQDSLSYEVSLNYLEVPLTAHGYIGKKNVRIFLEGGLYLAYLLSYETQRAPSVPLEQVTYVMGMAKANRLDIGIRGGGGFEVATRAGTFQLGGSYSFGLGSVLKKYQTTPDRAARNVPNMLQNQTVTITLGYFVEFGKISKN